MQAVLLAGGRGTRLRPYTTVFPKPLVPVGEQPISEIIVRQLAAAGFDRIVFTVSHLAGLIEAYFGDGRRWGVEITYSREDEPLGTVGPIGILDGLDDDFLIMNGDVLTDLDYRALMAEHRAHGAIATLTTYRKPVPISLGVTEVSESNALLDYVEKPTLHYRVSMGIYALQRRILDFVPRGQRMDFPDLMKLLIARGERVHCYDFRGQWLDIGRVEDYDDAQSQFAADPGRFDPGARS
jgi:NDP-sugar pyrophosphorylase family protein